MDYLIGRHLSWGLGLQVDDGFGMSGIGGGTGAVSRMGDYAICLLPGYLSDHSRADRLERVLRECLGVLPLG